MDAQSGFAQSSVAQWASVMAAALALLVSVAAFALAEHRHRSAARAERMRNLLAHHATVGYAAIRLLHEGLPAARDERRLLVQAIVHACVFEPSDRARALLYAVIRENPRYNTEFQNACRVTSRAFEAVQDLRKGRSEEKSRGHAKLDLLEAEDLLSLLKIAVTAPPRPDVTAEHGR